MGPNKHNIHRIRYGILRFDPTGLSHIYNLTDISNAHVHRPIREKDNNFGNKLQVKRHGTDQAFKWWPVTLKIRSGMLFPNLTLKKKAKFCISPVMTQKSCLLIFAEQTSKSATENTEYNIT